MRSHGNNVRDVIIAHMINADTQNIYIHTYIQTDTENVRTSRPRMKCVAICLKNLGRTLVRHLCSGSTVKSEDKEIMSMSKGMSQETANTVQIQRIVYS